VRQHSPAPLSVVSSRLSTDPGRVCRSSLAMFRPCASVAASVVWGAVAVALSIAVRRPTSTASTSADLGTNNTRTQPIGPTSKPMKKPSSGRPLDGPIAAPTQPSAATKSQDNDDAHAFRYRPSEMLLVGQVERANPASRRSNGGSLIRVGSPVGGLDDRQTSLQW